MDIKDLVIYRNLEHQELFRDIAHLMGYAQGGQEPDGASCGGRLTEMAVKYLSLIHISEPTRPY